jgi:hypothetical protein
MDIHVWGCPVYILNLKVQQGQNLRRWQPCSHQGIFMGLSQHHNSEAPGDINVSTWSITTQFHVVFDDQFTTVNSIGQEEEHSCQWEEICLKNSVQVIADGPDNYIHTDWLTNDELDVKRRDI